MWFKKFKQLSPVYLKTPRLTNTKISKRIKAKSELSNKECVEGHLALGSSLIEYIIVKPTNNHYLQREAPHKT